MSAAAAWRRDLEAWALPQELLDAVDESPYGLPPELFRRRSEAARSDDEEPATTTLVRSLLRPSGRLLDVGAGAGRASLPLASEGHHLTAVERAPGMLAALHEEAAASEGEVTIIDGSWPEAAGSAGRHDVAMCAHVVYDVQDIGPFVQALHDAARRGVVVELTPAHPWAWLTPYYRALHGLDRPAGPTADDLARVVAEVTGVAPHVKRWDRRGGLRFASRDELLALFQRRLLLPDARRAELATLLEPDIVHVDGGLVLGPERRDVVTVWWEIG